MEDLFFKAPILNSPYAYPTRHWELDERGVPTQRIIEGRREAEFITPVPKSQKQKRSARQGELDLGQSGQDAQEYNPYPIINQVRREVDAWRTLTNPAHWNVTPVTQRLLQYWRHHPFAGIRPFFCQLEAVEVAIWLSEVAPKHKRYHLFLEHLTNANLEANPSLHRLALKLATGAGKTTVMAMLIAWQTLNAVRNPDSKSFTRGFLIIAPGITIRDRLRVLQPSDPESYFRTRELVPSDMVEDLGKARIVITNYHAFKLREKLSLSAGNRKLLQGRGPEFRTTESEGEMIRRVMPELMSMKQIMVLNDEAHHCYRENPKAKEERLAKLSSEEAEEVKKNTEAARLWISGIEAVQRKLGVRRVMDLSATPFFLAGSGYKEGTLFPWTMSDFSLMDAIECGIVKLPRIPVADNVPGEEMPKFRNLWEHISPKMPKKGRGKGGALNPLDLPVVLQTALDALYGHYAKTYNLWAEQGIPFPPCFIIVCNNTATSKLVYDLISGFHYDQEDGSKGFHQGRLPLFQNFDSQGNALARPRTLLIDSTQLESGEALDTAFRDAAAEEIALFKRDLIERKNDPHAADKLSDADILREVMNTVGKTGKLGESIRCVVSVSMLTEGWDANNVTHILGVRTFGTQLLCEQVVGRGLRRQSYVLNDEDRFNVEYADILGIPFNFTAKPTVAPPQPPVQSTHIKAMRPERDHLEIKFPRVEGYHIELPIEKPEARFNEDARLHLTPTLVGPAITRVAGIIGEGVELNLEHLDRMRLSTLEFHLTRHLLLTHYRDANEEPKLHLFQALKRIVAEWLRDYLTCSGGTFPQQLMYLQLAQMACERITAAITLRYKEERPVQVTLDPFNPEGSTRHVNFTTTKKNLWQTQPNKCHVNFAVLDSTWEGEFCRVVENIPRIHSYVKNHNLGLEVPYEMGGERRTYLPDFILRIDDGHGENDLLHLIVEVKGYRGEDAKVKKQTMDAFWIPGVNRRKKNFGRWAFAELTDVFAMEQDLEKKIREEMDRILLTLIPAEIHS